MYQLKIKVSNKRAGHHLPTSLTFIRQIWLEVLVTNSMGNTVFTSGVLGADNSLPDGTVIFRNNTVDKDGKDTVDPWKIAGVTETNTIPPKGHRHGLYHFNISPYATGFNVTVRLHYRSYDQAVADVLLGKGAITVPSVTMKTLSRSFNMRGQMVADQQATPRQ